MNAKTIAITNQKGGVGKTTTCANLGIGLALEGKKVLLIDTDPQGSLSISLGYAQPDKLDTTLATVMGKVMTDTPLQHKEGILSHHEGVDLMPANIELSGMEVSLVNTMSRETVLKQYLDTVKKQYDFILLDCMPSLGMLTVNALAASDSVIIPVQAQYLPAKGLEQLLQTISKVRKQINPKLKIDGILLTMVDSRTNFAKDICTLLRETYGSSMRIFSTDIPHSVRAAETSADANREKVMEIPLTELFPFKDHPFKVIDNEAMFDTAESVKQYGVLVPAIARPRDEGGYELVAGHRRKRACELAELETMPVIVRNLDDDAATIIMVDSNLQRDTLLPSERAFAFKMKLSAMKRQAGRPSKENGSQVGNNISGRKSSDILAEQMGESKNQIFRYIRLTELTPELLSMVDEKKIAFNPAVELSYLKKEEQADLLEAMDMEQATPSLSQAQRLKKFSAEGKCTLEVMCAIMSEEKKGELDKVTLTGDKLRKYFPKSYTPQKMEETIIKLLEGWQKKRQQQQER